MRGKILKWVLLITALAVFAIFLFQSISTPVNNSNNISFAETNAETGIPSRIRIPSININASIEQVGLTHDGSSMDTPTNPLDTAWYKLGPRPGEIGSAVIDGHVDDKYGAKAVFANLKNLKPGDKIIVQNNNGISVSFVVRKSQIYNSNSDSSNIFFSNDGKAHLNLITCNGIWDKTAGTYSERLVVFSDEE